MTTCTQSSQMEVLLRIIAGTFIIIAAVLSVVHSPNWIYLLGFIGLNLLQSSFTDWWPMMTILQKASM